VGFLWWGRKPSEPGLVVRPKATVTLLYGRFLEQLQLVLLKWNESLEPKDRLDQDKLEALMGELGDHFESWFMRGFPPIEKR
jgi:hypothetical protein